jgi:hypothetical protein
VKRGVIARAKLLAAKEPLGQAMPFVTSFLRYFPVVIEENPPVNPAYITPKPACVFALEAVEKYSLAELRTIMLHEALHVLGDVYGRCGERDWDLWVMADDMKNDLLINEEINRLERQGLNGKDRYTALLAWPKDLPPKLDYRFFGWTTEGIYEVLAEQRAQGLDLPYEAPCDCPEDYRGRIVEVQQGYAYMCRALQHAVLEAQDAGESSGSLLLSFALTIAQPRLPWNVIMAQAIERELDHFERRSYRHPRPRDRAREDDVFTAGYRHVGCSLAIATDISGTTTQRGARAAERFLEEADAAALSYEGPVRQILWDDRVRFDKMVSGDQRLQDAMTGVYGGGGTQPACLLEHLMMPACNVDGLELPEPGYLVIFTDGMVQEWPELQSWPCPVLVVYTKKAPPASYPSVHLEVA